MLIRMCSSDNAGGMSAPACWRCGHPLILFGLLQRSHVDHEPVFPVALEQAVVGFVDLLHFDHLDIRIDSLLGAEIEHLLGFGNAADGGAREAAPAHD